MKRNIENLAFNKKMQCFKFQMWKFYKKTKLQDFIPLKGWFTQKEGM